MRPSSHDPAPGRARAVRGWTGAAAALVLLCLGGCAQDLSVHARIGAPPPRPEALTAADGEGPLVLSDGIEVDRVQLVLRKLRLESLPTVGDEASQGREVLLEGPALVDLSGRDLEGARLNEILTEAHGGLKSFAELDFDLAPVTEAELRASPELAPLLGESVVISGRYQGAPFVVASDFQGVFKSEFPFILGTNHNNIDLNFDPDFWFAAPNDGLLDPADPKNRTAIVENLIRSFSAYEDDNLDGGPDRIE